MCKVREIGWAFLLALILLPLAGVSQVRAQCAGGQIVNCPADTAPQASDLLWGYQLNQIPHTRKFTLQDILTGGLQQPLGNKLTLKTSNAAGSGFNVGLGIAPSLCTAGDMWMTSAGTFDCPNGQPHGPLGTAGNFQGAFATSAGLPTVTSANAGSTAFVLNCANGSQAGGGATGCPYVVSSAGVWTAQPNPTSSAITVGGQALFPGGTSANQGNGSLIQLATGSFVVGHALAYDNNGNAVDSGVPPSGGVGGSGTVTASPQNAIPFYSSAGTANVVSGLTIVNNAVVATNGSGVPSLVTTLPTGLTLPSATISAGTFAGTIGTATHTGKDTLAAGTTGAASLNIPAGVAPTSPVNGDIWSTTAGVFARVNGALQGPFVGNVATTAPLSGGAVGPTVTVACTTCATTTNGGALTATSPISISAAGLISLGTIIRPVTFIADSATTVHNDTYVFFKWPFVNSGTIKQVTYHTGGTATPSFVVSIQINGSNVTGCNTLSVTSSTDAVATCTAANTIAAGQPLSLVISGVTGSPSSAFVEVDVNAPAS